MKKALLLLFFAGFAALSSDTHAADRSWWQRLGRAPRIAPLTCGEAIEQPSIADQALEADGVEISNLVAEAMRTKRFITDDYNILSRVECGVTDAVPKAVDRFMEGKAIYKKGAICHATKRDTVNGTDFVLSRHLPLRSNYQTLLDALLPARALDLVILDIDDGSPGEPLRFYEAFRTKFPEAIILVSGAHDSALAERISQEGGASYFVTKP